MVNDSNDKKFKVTDKRLFTTDGELREEYRELDADATTAADPPSEPMSPPGSASPPEPRGDAGTIPGPDREARPTVFDLIGVVAQPIALYLGDAKMPDGESMENLELARLYIDLLEILQEKTEGNLSEQEGAFLEDLLYQLRLRFVEKRKQGD